MKAVPWAGPGLWAGRDRKSTRLNSSHGYISYAVFCLKKKNIVRDPGVQAVAVRLGVHRDGLDPQLLARADHPQGDVPAVRDQHLLEHQDSMSPRRPAP